MTSSRSTPQGKPRRTRAATSLAAARSAVPQLVLAIVGFLSAPLTCGQPPSGAAAPLEREPESQGLDAEDMASYMDGMVAAQLRERDVAGAVAAVVYRGEVVHLGGYGYADVHAGELADPERTLFRIGSVTKLFTYTAVMQLVEEGRLDLDTDVNEYLDFVIPATHADPITLRHLMTHTAGFEEDIRNLFTDDPARVVLLGHWLRDNLPARVRPPGAFSAYSNYGSALAGYIVERVSGVPWEELIEARILDPLGMSRTTGRQPLPDHLAPLMSGGYVPAGGGYRPEAWELIMGAAPAGSMSATAADMARFMLAFLGGGALGDARILDESTATRMLERDFGHHPRLPGYALGFYEMSSHGVRILGHAGNTQLFHTVLALFPEHELGVFVSYNTATAAPLTYGPFLQTLLDRYFSDPPPRAAAADPADLARLAGYYRFNRMSYTTFQKALGLVATLNVRADDGVLLAGSPLGALRLSQVEPLLFREELGAVRVAFRTDAAGRPTHAFVSLIPMMAAERVPWHGLPPLHFAIIGAALLLFVATLVTAAGAVSWRRRAPVEEPRALTIGRRALLVAAAANVAFVPLVAILARDLFAFLTTPMTGFAIALALPVLGAVAILVAALATVLLWWDGTGSRWLRVRYTAAVTIGLLFIWSLNYWNLLGWRM